MTEEGFLIAQISRLQEQYELAAEPYLRRLSAIRAREPQRINITKESYDELVRSGILSASHGNYTT